MMTHENCVSTSHGSQVAVSTMWRGMDDSSMEEVYYFLFHHLFKDKLVLPSVVTLEYLKLGILEYLLTTCKAKLVCTSQYVETADSVGVRDEDVFAEISEVNKDKVHLFIIDKPFCEYPVLLRLNFDKKKYQCIACSFDSECLEKFMMLLREKFGFVPDYQNDVVFGVLYPEGARLTVKELPLDDKHVKDINLGLNYGPTFLDHHKTVVSKLENNRRGLFIFHGEPGTGKTTYIKHLAHLYGGKRMFIFIPTTNLETLVSPSLLPVLLDHANSVLVLEDAEKAVVSRENQMGNESLVSTLLNIGDGILGSMLNLSLIVTFNTKKDKIDSALLRKGRLLYEHEFKSLSIEHARALLQSLGHDGQIKEPMTLADIYNISSATGHVEEVRRTIGFR